MKRIFGLLLLSVVLFSCKKEKEVVDPGPIPTPGGSMALSDITSTSIKVTVTPINYSFSRIEPYIRYFDASAADTTVYTQVELTDSIYTIANLKPATNYVFKLYVLDFDVYYRAQRLTFTTASDL
jgi:hypothetical protein